jgi:hypothetical protein
MADPRDPKTGWVLPKVDDAIIVASRRGMTATFIAQLKGVPEDHVKAVQMRAFHQQLLNAAEAAAIGLFA